jgi:hydroxyacyl-ACP dehydratase HTD2-like protein with hotdog domain
MGQVCFEDVETGLEIPSLVKRCSTRQLVMWAAASGDFYEIHYDLEYAKSIGLPGLVVHGALKHAFLGQLVHGWIAPRGRLVRFGCSYRGLDYPDQDIVCRGVVRRKYQADARNLVELDIWTEQADGTVTTPGSALVALPGRGA